MKQALSMCVRRIYYKTLAFECAQKEPPAPTSEELTRVTMLIVKSILAAAIVTSVILLVDPSEEMVAKFLSKVRRILIVGVFYTQTRRRQQFENTHWTQVFWYIFYEAYEGLSLYRVKNCTRIVISRRVDASSLAPRFIPGTARYC